MIISQIYFSAAQSAMKLYNQRTTTILIAFTLLLILASANKCPANCTDCDVDGQVCFSCAEGFESSVMGTCIDASILTRCTLYSPSNECFVCQATYSLDSSGKCVKNESPCIATDPSDDSACINCAFGTALQNKKCIGSINCKKA